MNKAERAINALREAADAYEALPDGMKRNSLLGGKWVDANRLRQEADFIDSCVELVREAMSEPDAPPGYSFTEPMAGVLFPDLRYLANHGNTAMDKGLSAETVKGLLELSAQPVGWIPDGVFIGSEPPECFMFCEGQTYDPEDYPELYAAIGDSYGRITSPAHLPRLPDLRGRVVSGLGGSGLANYRFKLVPDVDIEYSIPHRLIKVKPTGWEGRWQNGRYVD